MRYTLVLAVFLIFMLTLFHPSRFMIAQTSDREVCDEEICHVKITKQGFVPKTLIVKIGTTIVWTNTDDSRHTVTSGSPGEITEPFKSLLLDNGSTYEFIFTPTSLFQGSYKYFDQVTKVLRGEIIVEPKLEEVEEKISETQTIKLDFNDPQSGIKQISLPTGTVKSLDLDPNVIALILAVEKVEIPGKLTITFDRNLIDAKINNTDDRFIVLVDDEEAFFDEISVTAAERSLQIVVPSKTTSIEIRGTVSFFVRATIALSEADEVVEEHKSRGIVITDAENRLNEAKGAFGNGRYADAEILANDAKIIANNIGNNALVANKALDLAEEAIEESNAQGFDVSNAQQLFDLARQEYDNGNYDKALSLAQQVKTAVSEATNIQTGVSDQTQVEANDARTNPFDQPYIIAGVVAASAAAAGTALYARFRRRGMEEKVVSGISIELEKKRIIDLNKILTERPHLREDDKEVMKYIVEKGGVAFGSEIKEKFNLPKTTVWRLVRRLERDGLVQVKKTGGQNLIRIRDEFARTDQNSVPS